jgi:hypothetical protein
MEREPEEKPSGSENQIRPQNRAAAQAPRHADADVKRKTRGAARGGATSWHDRSRVSRKLLLPAYSHCMLTRAPTSASLRVDPRARGRQAGGCGRAGTGSQSQRSKLRAPRYTVFFFPPPLARSKKDHLEISLPKTSSFLLSTRRYSNSALIFQN